MPGFSIQLRVVPAPGSGWRVEGPSGVHGVCATIGEAQAMAERFLGRIGGGEILVYDEDRNLHAVKRMPVGPQDQ